MTTLIETERLIMRRFTRDDVDAVHTFSQHPEVTRWTGDAGVVTTKADALNVIESVWLKEYEQYGYARYALVHKGDDKVIGFCGLKFEPDYGLPDLGYRMLPEYWGQGLGEEAARAALEYAKTTLGMTHIVAEAVVENIGSNRILEKIGFQKTKQVTKDGFTLNVFEITF